MALEKRTGAAIDVTNSNMNVYREYLELDNLERLLTYLYQHCSVSFEFWWDAGGMLVGDLWAAGSVCSCRDPAINHDPQTAKSCLPIMNSILSRLYAAYNSMN